MSLPEPPRYMPYYSSSSGHGLDHGALLNVIQHAAIDKNITDTGRDISRDVGYVGRNIYDGVNRVNDFTGASTAGQTNSMQHAAIDKNITDSSRDISRDVGAVSKYVSDGSNRTNDLIAASTYNINKNIYDGHRDLTRDVGSVGRYIASDICKTNELIGTSTAGLRDTFAAGTMNTRDAVERNGTATNSTLNNIGSASSDRDRDILQAIERSAGESRYTTAVLSATDRQAATDVARDGVMQSNRGMSDILTSVAAGGVSTNTNMSNIAASASDRDRDILQAIERNAGELRYYNAIENSTSRQSNNDLARDIMMQTVRGTNDVTTAIDRNGVASVLASTSAGYENRALINTNSNINQQATLQTKFELGSQSASQYTSTLLEQQKAKEWMSMQLCDNKYEALKNKEVLAAQLAVASCEAKYEALKNKEVLSAQLAVSSSDAKYEALKNTQTLEKQLAECCCELKVKISDASCESKYEALKNAQLLSAQLASCCCEIKEKVHSVSYKVDDTVRDLDARRVRDALSVASNENNLLKIVEASRHHGYGGYHGDYHRHCSPRRSRSPPGHGGH